MRAKRVLKMTIVAALVATMSFGWTAAVTAAGPAKIQAKADWYFHDIIPADFVKDWAKLPKPENVLIIDARPTQKYDKGHIPTAINIPHRQFNKFKHLLPEKKSTVLIYYCGGYK